MAKTEISGPGPKTPPRDPPGTPLRDPPIGMPPIPPQTATDSPEIDPLDPPWDPLPGPPYRDPPGPPPGPPGTPPGPPGKFPGRGENPGARGRAGARPGVHILHPPRGLEGGPIGGHKGSQRASQRGSRRGSQGGPKGVSGGSGGAPPGRTCARIRSAAHPCVPARSLTVDTTALVVVTIDHVVVIRRARVAAPSSPSSASPSTNITREMVSTPIGISPRVVAVHIACRTPTGRSVLRVARNATGIPPPRSTLRPVDTARKLGGYGKPRPLRACSSGTLPGYLPGVAGPPSGTPWDPPPGPP